MEGVVGCQAASKQVFKVGALGEEGSATCEGGSDYDWLRLSNHSTKQP
jgi:hypothetical protein